MNLHLISHTHWDREWYLTFQQFRLKLVHLVDNLLDLLAKDPNFRFFMLDGQTIVLEDYLRMRPEREATLREYIQSGRMLIGPWYILPDEFLVSPEATIRNLLQGDRTTRRFGFKMLIGYLPDTFGHIGQMPQILRGFGIGYAALRRGLADEPCEVIWEAPDTSKVLTAYLRDGYDNAMYLPARDPERFASEVTRLREKLTPHTAANDVLLMFGTDHMEPSPHTSQAIAAAQDKLNGDTLIHSTLPDYFKALVASPALRNIPTVTGELRNPKRHHLLPGVLSTRMWIKQRNRASEALLEKWTEPFTTFAELVARDDLKRKRVTSPLSGFISSDRINNPAPLVREAWRLLMENHPHDSICGCSLDQVHAEMQVRFDQVDQVAEELTRQSLMSLASAVTTSPPNFDAMQAIVIFNPSGLARTDWVLASPTIPDDVLAFEIADQYGKVVPHQITGAGHRELLNVALDKQAFRDMLNMVVEGRISGMAIQHIKVNRREGQVFLEISLQEGGEPDKSVWQMGRQQAYMLLGDPAIQTFNIRAITAQAATVIFVARDVPAHGWRTYWARIKTQVTQPVQAQAALNPITRPLMPLALKLAQTPFGQSLINRLNGSDETKPPFKIENEFYVIEASPEDGTLTIRDRFNVMVYRGLNQFVDGGDAGDTYNYAPPATDTLIRAKLTSLRVYRRPLQPTLEIAYTLDAPLSLSSDRAGRAAETRPIEIISRVTLTTGVQRVDISTEVLNTVQDHRLRVHFPTPFSPDSAACDGHFETVRRKANVPAFDDTWVEQPRPEMPQRLFTSVGTENVGFILANRGLPEVEVLKDAGGKAELALTLLRCVGWLSRDDFSTRQGHAGPAIETPGAQMPGRWVFEYALIPHSFDSNIAREHVYAFETPMRAVSVPMQVGSLGISGSFIFHEPAALTLTAIKGAEDGNGLIVRGYNASDAPIRVNLIPWRVFKNAAQCNLKEDLLALLSPAADGGVTFQARPYEIVTVRFSDQ